MRPPKPLNAEDLFASAETETTVPEPFALRNLEREDAIPIAAVSRERLRDYAKHIVQKSVNPTKSVLEAIARSYGDIQTIGRARARQPDMVFRIRPDFFVLTSSGKRVIVEEKSKASEKLRFKAKFYNGLTESDGVFIVEERWENGLPALEPRVVREPVETLLVYPSSDEVVEEKLPVSIELVRRVALAKQLGYGGKCPVERCGADCNHNRLHLKLVKEHSEPLRLLGLAFCELLQRENYNFDFHYQTFYKWHLGDWLGEFFQDELLEPARWNEWLKEAVCLDPYVVDDLWKDMYEVGAKMLLKKTGREGDLWGRILHGAFNARDAQYVLGKGRGVFALPQGSELFLKGAIERWVS